MTVVCCQGWAFSLVCLSPPWYQRSPAESAGSAVLLLIIRWDWRFYCWLPGNNPCFTKDLCFLFLSYPTLTMLLAVLLAVSLAVSIAVTGGVHWVSVVH